MIQLGFDRLTPEARFILQTLAAIELILSAAIWALSLGGDMLGNLMFKGLRFSFFGILITQLRPITEAFVNSMVIVGLLVGGNQITVGQFLSPGTILAMGWMTTDPLLLYVEHLKGWFGTLINFPVIVIFTFAAIVCWLCWLLMACHILLAVIEFQLLSVIALILLPWGVLSQTAFIAEGVLGGLVAGAVRLGCLAAVTSMIVPVIDTVTLSANPSYWEALSMMAAAIIFLIVSWAAPNLAASLTVGGPSLTGHALMRVITVGIYGAYRGARRLAGSLS